MLLRSSEKTRSKQRNVQTREYTWPSSTTGDGGSYTGFSGISDWGGYIINTKTKNVFILKILLMLTCLVIFTCYLLFWFWYYNIIYILFYIFCNLLITNDDNFKLFIKKEREFINKHVFYLYFNVGTGLLHIIGIDKFKELLGMTHKKLCYNCLAQGLSVILIMDGAGSVSRETRATTRSNIDANQRESSGSSYYFLFLTPVTVNN